MKNLLLSLPIISCSALLHAATINVPGPNNYTIQTGLDVASSGDTILVAPGTYNEHDINFNGKNIHLRSESGPDVTIIDGGLAGTVFKIISGEGRTTIIEGFTVQKGHGSSFYGGGFYIENASPTLLGNIIKNNSADSSGGGIKVSTGSNPLIQGNTIADNSAYQKGGGIHVYNASAEIYDNVISGNSAVGHIQAAGGGIGATYTSALTIKENTIESNSAGFAGGGISVYAGNVEILENDIIGNDGGDFAGGIHVETNTDYGDFTFRINENYICSNRALTGGGIHSFMHETASYVEILDNQIIENESVNPSCTAYDCSEPGKGGGLALYSRVLGLDSHVIRGNLIQNNRADLYAAALLIKMPVSFEANMVESNHSLYNYPGVSCVETLQCSVLRNRFLGNYGESFDPATRNPGGLYVKDSDLTQVTNNFFYNNTGFQSGAAEFINCLSPVKVVNNTFLDNSTLQLGGATIRTETAADFANNIFEGDTASIRLAGTTGPVVQIIHNNFHNQSSWITVNPNHDTVDSLNGESFAIGNTDYDCMLVGSQDYHLKSQSPCKDTGTPDGAPDADIDGDPRPRGSGYDMGADEFAGKAAPWLHLLLLEGSPL